MVSKFVRGSVGRKYTVYDQNAEYLNLTCAVKYLLQAVNNNRVDPGVGAV